jgi:hypothetical protein
MVVATHWTRRTLVQHEKLVLLNHVYTVACRCRPTRGILRLSLVGVRHCSSPIYDVLVTSLHLGQFLS